MSSLVCNHSNALLHSRLFENPPMTGLEYSRSRENFFLSLELQRINALQNCCDDSNQSIEPLRECSSSSSTCHPTRTRRRTHRSFSQCPTRGFTDDMMYYTDVKGRYSFGGRNIYSEDDMEPHLPPHLQHYDSESYSIL